MTISYPLSLPDTKRTRITLRPNSIVGVSVSPFTYQTQVQQFGAQILVWDVTSPPVAKDDAEAWITFFQNLDGRYGTFLLGDNTRSTPRGTATGTPLVKGASQTGNVLLTDGWTSNVTGILKDGDWIQLPGYRHHRVCGDVNSDGSGNATLQIFPRLRSSPSDNATIITSNTVGLYRMLNNESSIDIDQNKTVSIAFVAVEAI